MKFDFKKMLQDGNEKKRIFVAGGLSFVAFIAILLASGGNDSNSKQKIQKINPDKNKTAITIKAKDNNKTTKTTNVKSDKIIKSVKPKEDKALDVNKTKLLSEMGIIVETVEEVKKEAANEMKEKNATKEENKVSLPESEISGLGFKINKIYFGGTSKDVLLMDYELQNKDAEKRKIDAKIICEIINKKEHTKDEVETELFLNIAPKAIIKKNFQVIGKVAETKNIDVKCKITKNRFNFKEDGNINKIAKKIKEVAKDTEETFEKVKKEAPKIIDSAVEKTKKMSKNITEKVKDVADDILKELDEF
jgi:hypothetical protein